MLANAKNSVDEASGTVGAEGRTHPHETDITTAAIQADPRAVGARYSVLAALLMIALSSWGLNHVVDGHGLFGDPDERLQHLLSLMGVLGAVLLSWLSNSSSKVIA